MSESEIDGIAEDGGPALVVANNVDISNCDLEQVQLVGAIQPHGALLILKEPELIIVQASANTLDFLGVVCEALVGKTINALLGDDYTEALRLRIAETHLTDILALLMTAPCRSRSGRRFHLFGNRIDGLLLLEFELVDEDRCQKPQSDSLPILRNAFQSMRCASSLSAFLDSVVVQMQLITGFERVMAYRFDEGGSGEVVAEAKAPGLEAYLGLHYPASDIPKPARRLFAFSLLRHLPNVDYVPVPLFPAHSPLATGKPVDLSYSFLRSVSVMYTDHLRNMGVKATLVSPLLKEGKLWGLISCMQHSEPKYLSFENRVLVEMLIQTISMLLADQENYDHLAYRLRLDQVLVVLVTALGRVATFPEALLSGGANLLSVMDADGVALIADGKVLLLGQTPSPHQVSMIANWLAQQKAAVFSTHQLPHDFPPSSDFSAVASGLLTVSLTRTSSDRVIWFRPEVLSEVHWAGDPNKPVEIVGQDDQQLRLRPRTSFKLWKETVHCQSRPWLGCEIDHATKLRQAIIDVLVDRAKLLARANVELERSNQELDSFAYAASHDLKEPLRGINNFAEFLRAEDGARLSTMGSSRLETIIRLAGRMDNMLESLMQYSRIGRNELVLQPLPIRALLEQIVELIQQVNPSQDIKIEIQPAFPEISGDRVRVCMIFQNLIMNAIKYNDQEKKWIEIGCDSAQVPPVFFVRDNGIGIAPSHHELIFQLFRRLHGRDEYGGGTGAGLTIVKKAVARHGGNIWVESSEGRGSTFFFTLAHWQDRGAEKQ